MSEAMRLSRLLFARTGPLVVLGLLAGSVLSPAFCSLLDGIAVLLWFWNFATSVASRAQTVARTMGEKQWVEDSATGFVFWDCSCGE